MANEVKFLYRTGETLTFSAFTPNGALRGDAGQTLAEVGVTGYYTATPSTALLAGDCVAVYRDGSIIGSGEYRPQVVATSVTSARIINGTFDDDVSIGDPIEGWTKTGAGLVATSGGKLTIFESDPISGVYQDIDGFSNGTRYRLTYTISAATTGFIFSINEQEIVAEDDVISAGSYSFVFNYTNSNNSRISLIAALGVGISNIILKELVGEQEIIIENQQTIIDNQETAPVIYFGPGE